MEMETGAAGGKMSEDAWQAHFDLGGGPWEEGPERKARLEAEERQKIEVQRLKEERKRLKAEATAARKREEHEEHLFHFRAGAIDEFKSVLQFVANVGLCEQHYSEFSKRLGILLKKAEPQ
jgi:hypothetical protein